MEDSIEERTKVIIYTDQYRIMGHIDLLPSARLTDFMLDTRHFIAVTNAKIYSLDGKAILNTAFCDINKNHIIIITPENLAHK
jgi:hypothetical protein